MSIAEWFQLNRDEMRNKAQFMGSSYDGGNFLFKKVLISEILTSYIAARTAIFFQSLEIMVDATELSF